MTFIKGYSCQWYIIVVCIFIPQKTERRDSGVETDDEPMDLDDGSEKKRLPTFSDYFIVYPTQAGRIVRLEDRHSSRGFRLFLLIFENPFFFLPLCDACGILVPRPWIEPVPSAMRARSPNHWTTREVPHS